MQQEKMPKEPLEKIKKNKRVFSDKEAYIRFLDTLNIKYLCYTLLCY